MDSDSFIDTEMRWLEVALDLAWMLYVSVLIFFFLAARFMLDMTITRSNHHSRHLLKMPIVIAVQVISFFMTGYNFSMGSEGGILGGKASYVAVDTSLMRFLFYLVLCILQTTIALGTLHERAYFTTYIFFPLIQGTLIFPLIIAWVWEGGWLNELGFQDFSGASIVHLSAGISAMVASLVIGPRAVIDPKKQQEVALMLKDDKSKREQEQLIRQDTDAPAIITVKSQNEAASDFDIASRVSDQSSRAPRMMTIYDSEAEPITRAPLGLRVQRQSTFARQSEKNLGAFFSRRLETDYETDSHHLKLIPKKRGTKNVLSTKVAERNNLISQNSIFSKGNEGKPNHEEGKADGVEVTPRLGEGVKNYDGKYNDNLSVSWSSSISEKDEELEQTKLHLSDFKATPKHNMEGPSLGLKLPLNPSTPKPAESSKENLLPSLGFSGARQGDGFLDVPGRQLSFPAVRRRGSSFISLKEKLAPQGDRKRTQSIPQALGFPERIQLVRAQIKSNQKTASPFSRTAMDSSSNFRLKSPVRRDQSNTNKKWMEDSLPASAIMKDNSMAVDLISGVQPSGRMRSSSDSSKFKGRKVSAISDVRDLLKCLKSKEPKKKDGSLDSSSSFNFEDTSLISSRKSPQIQVTGVDSSKQTKPNDWSSHFKNFEFSKQGEVTPARRQQSIQLHICQEPSSASKIDSSNQGKSVSPGTVEAHSRDLQSRLASTGQGVLSREAQSKGTQSRGAGSKDAPDLQSKEIKTKDTPVFDEGMSFAMVPKIRKRTTSSFAGLGEESQGAGELSNKTRELFSSKKETASTPQAIIGGGNSFFRSPPLATPSSQIPSSSQQLRRTPSKKLESLRQLGSSGTLNISPAKPGTQREESASRQLSLLTFDKAESNHYLGLTKSNTKMSQVSSAASPKTIRGYEQKATSSNNEIRRLKRQRDHKFKHLFKEASSLSRKDLKLIKQFLFLDASGVNERKTAAAISVYFSAGILFQIIAGLFINGGVMGLATIVGSSKSATQQLTNALVAIASSGVLQICIIYMQDMAASSREEEGEIYKAEKDREEIPSKLRSLANAALAGLISVSSVCNECTYWSPGIIGVVGCLFYNFGATVSDRLKSDDPLQIAAVHAFGGLWALISRGIFDAADGVSVSGSLRLLGVQSFGAICIILWSGTLSWIFYFIMHSQNRLRMSCLEELIGSDYFSKGGQGQLILRRDKLKKLLVSMQEEAY